MPHKNITEQMLVEHEMLKHIMDGLRAAIGWKLEGDDLSRKLSTISFIAQALQRHLDHLLNGRVGVVRCRSRSVSSSRWLGRVARSSVLDGKADRFGQQQSQHSDRQTQQPRKIQVRLQERPAGTNS